MDLDFGFELDGFQKEAQEHICSQRSVVVCAPTGAGKTVIAQIAIHKAFELNKRLFYTTPLKALSNQKYRDFCQKYGEDNVGLLTGDISINRGAQIVVMTTEVFRNMLYGTNLGKIEENLQNVEFVLVPLNLRHILQQSFFLSKMQLNYFRLKQTLICFCFCLNKSF